MKTEGEDEDLENEKERFSKEDMKENNSKPMAINVNAFL